MTPFRAPSLVAALGLTLAACTQPAPQEAPAAPAAPSTAATAPEIEKPFKKKPRMNGRGEITSISLEDFFVRHQAGNAMIFDARPGFIYQLGHIPGALNLTKHNCDAKIHKLEPQIKAALAEGKILVVYCSGIMCPDARAVATYISGFGYPASVFSGGWDAWTEAGMPAE
jgi:rhodanese-related sulfurtransferase